MSHLVDVEIIGYYQELAYKNVTPKMASPSFSILSCGFFFYDSHNTLVCTTES